MSFISWDESYSVGVKILDEDHQKLIAFITKLHIALLAKETGPSMVKILDGLIDYTAYHFSREENMMSEAGYPDLEEQKIMHQKFVEKAKEFQDRFSSGKASFSIELMSFLKDWLINHIQISDMKYKQYFNSKGIY
jgi:hemerythrin-like metal-binding protein